MKCKKQKEGRQHCQIKGRAGQQCRGVCVCVRALRGESKQRNAFWLLQGSFVCVCACVRVCVRVCVCICVCVLQAA